MSLTISQLYDLAVEKLGIGNYDDEGDRRPHWKYRRDQIGQLSRQLKQRQLPMDDVEFTVHWCAARHLHVPHVWSLVRHVEEALRWQRSQASADTVEEQIADAIARERSLRPDSLWINRLSRARGESRKAALTEWREATGG